MYSFPNLEPAHSSMSNSNCYFLTWKQVSQEHTCIPVSPVWWSGIPISWRIFQFVVIHRVTGFGIVNEAEVDVLLEFSCFFYDPVNADNLIYGSSSFSKSSLNIWKLRVHILLKPGLENFEHYFASVWNECNCAVVWAFLALPFFGIFIQTNFSSPVATAKFSKFAGILSAALSQHHLSGFEIAQNSPSQASAIREPRTSRCSS